MTTRNITEEISAPSEADNDYVVVLTDEEREAIRTALGQLPQLDVYQLQDDVVTEAQLAHVHVPRRLARLLIDFRRNSNPYGTLLIRNLPTDPQLPTTPTDSRPSPRKTSQISEGVLLLLITYLGEPIAYADEKEGVIIQNICPVVGREERQENTGSVFLEFHTEDGFHPHKPDFISLFCLRPDHDRSAKTATASIRRALPLLSTKTQALLRQPLYHIRLASSFMQEGQPVLYSPPRPVISGDVLEPEMCIDFHAMEAINPSAQVALNEVQEALEQVIIAHVLLPGEIIVVDNNIAAHARTGFQPHYDGEDRWLQRMFVVQDFRRSRSSRANGGHICTPLLVEFSATDECGGIV